jgi:hypothetical protein
MLGSVLTGLGLSFFTMFLWYFTQPVTMMVIQKTMDVAATMGVTFNSYVLNGITILTYIEYWWGPLMLIAIAVIWMLTSIVRRDTESQMDTQW